MEFVNPGFLYGLLAISIPVIIHLFNFRKFRKVYFTNVEFIRELKQETQKHSNLKHLLVLIARILAVSAVVLAFARPYIPIDDNVIRPQEQNSISIYVDNSFSMQAESENGTLLQTALEKAREIASVYSSTDRFQLLTNDFEGRHLRFVSREEFLDLLDETDFSPVVRNFDEVCIRLADLQRLESSKVRSSYFISDFQRHFLTDTKQQADTLLNGYFIPLQSVGSDNLYIDSCWFDSPVQQENQLVKLYLKVRNSSDNSYEDLPVRLKINDQQRALGSFGIAPRAERTVELAYSNQETGIQAGEIEINDYPVNFDDRFYFSYKVNPVIHVLSINQDLPDDHLNSLFRSDSSLRFDNMPVDRLNFPAMQDYQFIILNGLIKISSGLGQEILRFLRAGGSVLILPPDELPDETYNILAREAGAAYYGILDTTSQRVGKINLEHPLYAGVFEEVPEQMDLPVVNRHFRLNPSLQARQEILLALQSGDIFLGQYNIENGKLYLSSVPFKPAFSNFPQHAIFVPTLYKMAVSSVNPHELYYLLGRNEVIRIESVRRAADEVLRIVNADGSYEVIPEQRRVGHMEDLFVYDQIHEAGNYSLFNSGDVVRGLSFNYDRTESEMVFYSPEELKKLIADRQISGIRVLETTGKPFAQTLADMSKGIQFWKWLILAALAFLLMEVLLLRFMR